MRKFRKNLSVSSSSVKNPKFYLDILPLKMGSINRPETSVRNCHYTLCNSLKEPSSLEYINFIYGTSIKIGCTKSQREDRGSYEKILLLHTQDITTPHTRYYYSTHKILLLHTQDITTPHTKYYYSTHTHDLLIAFNYRPN